jgi:hypothetical protein
MTSPLLPVLLGRQPATLRQAVDVEFPLLSPAT